MSGEYEISPLSGTDRAVQSIAVIGNSKLCKLSSIRITCMYCTDSDA